LAQHVEVEVDGPSADVAAAEARDEGVAEAVQQRAAEQDRDPRGARVGIDVGDVGALHVRGVEDEFPGLVARTDRHPVQLQQAAYDTDVADVRNIAQSARSTAQQGGDHGLRYEVLRTADTDLALQRGSAVDQQYVISAVDGHGSRVPWGGGAGPKGTGESATGPLLYARTGSGHVMDPSQHEPFGGGHGRSREPPCAGSAPGRPELRPLPCAHCLPTGCEDAGSCLA